jgi:hypothetical protein
MKMKDNIKYILLIFFAGIICAESLAIHRDQTQINSLLCNIDVMAGTIDHLNAENKALQEIPPVEVEHTVYVYDPQPEFTFTEEEMMIMAGVVHAEAGNQDLLGRRLVADVILNRIENARFPDTVYGVIYQSGQFSRPATKIDNEDMQAVMMECQKRVDTNVLWFRTKQYHKIGDPIYQHGAHYFSGEI